MKPSDHGDISWNRDVEDRKCFHFLLRCFYSVGGEVSDKFGPLNHGGRETSRGPELMIAS